MRPLLFALLLLAASREKSVEAAVAVPRRPSILYLMCDDLRPQLKAYGFNQTLTPHLDALAAKSLTFTRAYTQFPFCAPSRNSFMSGRRPDRTRVWNFLDHFRMVGANWTAMPQFFKENGYFTTAAGKLYHPDLPPKEDPPSWSDNDKWPGQDVNWTHCTGAQQNYCTPTRDDDPTYDENQIVSLGLPRLRHALATDAPFWVGVGLHRPHWPWRMPSSFLDQLPPVAQIALPTHPLPPKGIPQIAMNFLTEMIDLSWHCFDCTVTDQNARIYRRHYYASINYADYKLGQVLAELEASGRANDTIIVFHSDHGYQLGEHNEWTKMTNFELAARVPLMIHVPWLPSSYGKKSDTIVELIDMYRTLADLVNLSSSVEPGVQGSSFAPLFHNPTQRLSTLQSFAQTQIPRCGCHRDAYGFERCTNCFQTNSSNFEYMGFSIRTEAWRYNAWVGWNGKTLQPRWDNVAARELYAHTGDDGTSFDDWENENVADDPAHADTVAQLHATLVAAFQNDH
eukprot:m.5170 g.5170  ORF g.5170 m.5170 type:complete len:511 (-) comp4470_c0_seq2:36-1568(-)